MTHLERRAIRVALATANFRRSPGLRTKLVLALIKSMWRHQ